MKRLIYLLMTMLGFGVAGCEHWLGVAEYGCPHVDFKLSARVVDESGEPIQGIHVYPAGYTFPGREGYTDYRGEIGANTHIEPYRQVKIVFEDVDGEYNRGVWQSRTIDITSQIDPPQVADKWGYSGSCFLELGDVVLSPAAQ